MGRNRGFTLIELLVVVTIIGILASIVLVSLGSARGKARDAGRIADINVISSALELYYFDNLQYPSQLTQLGPIITVPSPRLPAVPLLPAGPGCRRALRPVLRSSAAPGAPPERR